MTSRISEVRRFVASGALLVWCALAAIVPAADAYAERASAGARAHIEGVGGSASCPPVHSEFACQLCRILRLPVKTGDATALLSFKTAARINVAGTQLSLATIDRESGHFSRAPPTA